MRRFIYFSSVKAVADPGDECIDETWSAEPSPDDPYGRSKRDAERAVAAAATTGGMEFCVLRPTLVYGAGAKGNLWRMMDAIERGRFPPLPESGNRRSMVHVEDLADAALVAAEHPAAAGRTYIVSDRRDYSSRELYLAIRAALGREAPRWTTPAWLLRAGGVVGESLRRLGVSGFPLDARAVERLLGSACYRGDRIHAELGFTPERDLITSLAEMAAAFREGRGERG